MVWKDKENNSEISQYEFGSIFDSYFCIERVPICIKNKRI